MFILTLHILVAVVTTVAIVGVTAAARRQHESRLYGIMLGSFAATAVSGIGLLFVSVGGLGRFCAMMSMYVVFVALARAYYRRQVMASSSL